jgi:hypothetical protein
LKLLKIYPEFPADRIRTVNLASRFSEQTSSTPLPGLEKDGFWLYVGPPMSDLVFKQFMHEFWRHILATSDIKHLVLVGAISETHLQFDEGDMASQLEDRVRIIADVNDLELFWLYENCFGFLQPFSIVGSLVPVVEAMTAGAALILSKTENFQELSVDAALYVDMTSAENLSLAMRTLHEDDTLRAGLKEKALNQGQKFSWTEFIDQIHKIYGQAHEIPKREENFEACAEYKQSDGPTGSHKITYSNNLFTNNSGCFETSPFFIYISEKKIGLRLRFTSWVRRTLNKNPTNKNRLKGMRPINKLFQWVRSKLSKDFPEWV